MSLLLSSGYPPSWPGRFPARHNPKGASTRIAQGPTLGTSTCLRGTVAAEPGASLAPPGVCIASDVIGGLYGGAAGTSFASPIIAGTVARCLASGSKPCAGLTPAQIVKEIISDAQAYSTLNPG